MIAEPEAAGTVWSFIAKRLGIGLLNDLNNRVNPVAGDVGVLTAAKLGSI